MCLRGLCKCAKLAAPAAGLFLALAIVAFERAAEAKIAAVSGVIFTVASDRAQTVWPNARVTLRNRDTNNQVATVSNDLGVYTFADVLPGHYELAVALGG